MDRAVHYTKEDTNIAKTIAIVLMYIHHLFFSKDTYHGYSVIFKPFSEQQILTLASVGKVCVAIFVFLTAYGITQKWRQRNYNIRECYADDFCRYLKLIFSFLTVYILALIFSFLGRTTAEAYGTGIKRMAYAVIDMLGMAEIFQTPTLNPTWWYMGLAISIFLILPLIYFGTKRLGIVILLFCVVFFRMLHLEFTVLRWYLPSMCLGVYFAENKIMEKIGAGGYALKGNKFIKACFSIIGIVLITIIRIKVGILLDVLDALLAVLIIYCMFEIFGTANDRIKTVVGFVGKYSMNMFLIHTFIKTYYFKDFTYSFQYAGVILAVLILNTLIISVILEKVKKMSGFYRLTNTLIEKLRKVLL